MESKSRNMNGRAGVELSSRCIEELASRTAELVCDEIAKKDAERPHSYPLMGTRTAAKMLGISVETLRRRVAEFPHVNLRGRYYFRREALRAIIESGYYVKSCDYGKE